MGGRGSGNWYRRGSKITTESQHQIDIRWLKKHGCLQSGNIGTLSWSENCKHTGSIHYRMESDHLILDYRHRRHSGEWEAVEQYISIDRTACNYGGYRHWFFCPNCFRRVAILYGTGKYFLCRHCYGLAYSSQQESLPERLMRKTRKIRNRLGGGNSLLDPFPIKPKNMHWKTYFRLRDKAERASSVCWLNWGQRLGISSSISADLSMG